MIIGQLGAFVFNCQKCMGKGPAVVFVVFLPTGWGKGPLTRWQQSCSYAVRMVNKKL